MKSLLDTSLKQSTNTLECDCTSHSSRSIALLSTTFPPRGGSGVQRPYYQAKFLKQLGWDVAVFTESGAQSLIDPSFKPATEFGINVYTLPAECITSRYRFFRAVERKLRRKLLFPDEFSNWAKKVTNELLVERSRKKILFASVGSPSTLRILDKVARADQYNRFITVVDFRDFWALNQRLDVPEDRSGTAKQARREAFERRVLRTVNGVVVVSNAYKKRLLESYPWLSNDKVLVIENGFVEGDFAPIEGRINSREKSDYFTIRYTGFLLRDHDPDLFFSALGILKNSCPHVFKKIRFEYFGGNSSFVADLAQKHGVKDNCILRKYVPHSKVVELILTADALYLPFARGDGTIGGKTYEYLRSRRPLIPTFSGCEEPRRLLLNFGVSGFPSDSHPVNISNYIGQLFKNWESGCDLDLPHRTDFSSIERFQQTHCLSEWLTSLLNKDAC